MRLPRTLTFARKRARLLSYDGPFLWSRYGMKSSASDSRPSDFVHRVSVLRPPGEGSVLQKICETTNIVLLCGKKNMFEQVWFDGRLRDSIQRQGYWRRTIRLVAIKWRRDRKNGDARGTMRPTLAARVRTPGIALLKGHIGLKLSLRSSVRPSSGSLLVP